MADQPGQPAPPAGRQPFFTDLAGHARTHPGTSLDRWWSSARCQQPGTFITTLTDSALGEVDGEVAGGAPYQAWNAVIAADGHGIWTDTTHSGQVRRVPFFVEVDLGTEDLPRLAGKITAYENWSTKTGQVWPVLYWLGSPRREHHLHQRLATRPNFIPIATATRNRRTDDQDPSRSSLTTGLTLDPADPVWWLHCAHRWVAQTTSGAQTRAPTDIPAGAPIGAHHGPRRLSLADLAVTVTTSSPVHHAVPDPS